MNSRLSMLRRCRVRYQEILASREDMGLKRARSDADITMILAELALSLPENERVLVQEILTLHNQLWSFASGTQAKRGMHDGVQPMECISIPPRPEGQLDFVNGHPRLQPLMDAYIAREVHSPIGSARRGAYGSIASDLRSHVSLPYAVECARMALKGIERKLSYVSEKQKPDLLEKRAVYEEFVSYYEGVE